jgi:hypothetical protein
VGVGIGCCGVNDWESGNVEVVLWSDVSIQGGLLESQTIPRTCETGRWLSDGRGSGEKAMAWCKDQSLGSVRAGKKPSSGVGRRVG